MRRTCVALLTHARHVERIIGLPTSQYTNICFPLLVLNNVSPHLLLAYSQSPLYRHTVRIVHVCVSVCLWFFLCRSAWGGHSCGLHLNFTSLFKITASHSLKAHQPAFVRFNLNLGCRISSGNPAKKLEYLLLICLFLTALIVIYYLTAIMHLLTSTAPNSRPFVSVVSQIKNHEGDLFCYPIA